MILVQQFDVALHSGERGAQLVRCRHHKLVLEAVQLFLPFVCGTQGDGDLSILDGDSALTRKHGKYALLFVGEDMRTWIGKYEYAKLLLPFNERQPGERKSRPL